jgi:hypothetical protein
MRRPTGTVWPSAWLQRETEIGLLHPFGGQARADVGRVDPSISPSFGIRPQSVHTISHPPTACPHHGGVAPVDPPLGCRPMGQTPIYDQLRGERINADVPATGADPQLVGRPGEQAVLAVAPVPAAVFGPGPATDLDANQHHLVPTYPVGQPAGDGQRAVAVWGPRAGRSLVAPVRQAPAHAASSSPALPGSSRHSAARGKVADGHGAHRRHGGGPRPDQRSEPRPATPADAPFRWFDVDHDGGDSSSE